MVAVKWELLFKNALDNSKKAAPQRISSAAQLFFAEKHWEREEERKEIMLEKTVEKFKI